MQETGDEGEEGGSENDGCRGGEVIGELRCGQ